MRRLSLEMHGTSGENHSIMQYHVTLCFIWRDGMVFLKVEIVLNAENVNIIFITLAMDKASSIDTEFYKTNMILTEQYL